MSTQRNFRERKPMWAVDSGLGYLVGDGERVLLWRTRDLAQERLRPWKRFKVYPKGRVVKVEVKYVVAS